MAARSRVGFVAAAITAALLLTACVGGDPADPSASERPVGEPVVGGAAQMLQMTEPRSLDPALLTNVLPAGALLGNALYGALLVDDPQTGEVEFRLAEDFSSADGGNTFTLTLREDLVFSDGSPLTAEDIKFNWDRTKDPALGSAARAQAALIESTDVVNDRTLTISLVGPAPSFAQVVLTSSLNWIAKPEVLEAGQDAVDSNPIGAGPFTLEEWARQDVIELVRNDSYWDAPKPYLDRLTIRTSADAAQRFNTLASGAADVALELEPHNLARAADAGLRYETAPLNGGLVLLLNTSRPPFDDVRARQAVAAAIDLDVINDITQEGHDTIPETLFVESSPYFADLPLPQRDPERAQRLFDELAAEGKPLSFTFKTLALNYGPLLAESVQAQLSAFENVAVDVERVEFAEAATLAPSGDFEMFTSSVIFADPEPQLWLSFHGSSAGNVSRIDDADLSAALDAGRAAESGDDRFAAYETVQERLIELTPVIFHARAAFSVVGAREVGGIRLYGLGSVLPEELWIAQ